MGKPINTVYQAIMLAHTHAHTHARRKRNRSSATFASSSLSTVSSVADNFALGVTHASPCTCVFCIRLHSRDSVKWSNEPCEIVCKSPRQTRCLDGSADDVMQRGVLRNHNFHNCPNPTPSQNQYYLISVFGIGRGGGRVENFDTYRLERDARATASGEGGGSGLS